MVLIYALATAMRTELWGELAEVAAAFRGHTNADGG